MRKGAAVAAILSVLAAAAAIGVWVAIRSPDVVTEVKDTLAVAKKSVRVQDDESASVTTASGFIEADPIRVGAEQGGRIVSVYADEGDAVVQGELLAQLDDSILRSRIEVAEADLAVAQAMVAEVAAGAKPELLRTAEAQVAQARCAEAAADTVWQDALAVLEKPQELELALAEVRGELAALGYQEQQAKALANSGQAAVALAEDTIRMLEGMAPYDEWVLVGTFDLDELPPGIPLPPSPIDGTYLLDAYKIVIQTGVVTVYTRVTVQVPADVLEDAREKQASATYDAWTAWTALDQAEAARRGAESVLTELTRQREAPLVLEAQAHAAEASYQVAAAARELAESKAEGLRMGATPEQIGVAEAQVDAATAVLEALQVQLDQYVVRAPASGLVLERAAGAGDVVAPGASLMTLADVDRLSVTAYVPEGRLGGIRVDQQVYVTVDAFPGRAFAGRVSGIASQAEFSPKDVQTQEERASIVFAVRVAVDNPERALKPGMPAEVHFAPEPQQEAVPAAAREQPTGAPGSAGGEGSRAVPLLRATGSIEGRESAIVSELGGRVDQVLVEEGDRIEADQVVVELDSRSLSAQWAVARAAEETARANLAQVSSGAHPAEILAAEAAVEQGAAECKAAESALRDVEAMLGDPQEIHAQLVGVRASIAVEEAQVEEATSRVAAAEVERDRYRAQGSLEEKGMYAVWSYQVEAATVGVEVARARLRASQDKLAGLEAILDNPLAILSRVHAAQGHHEVTCAGLAVARARLEELTAGPSDESVGVAEAQVVRSAAAARLVESQIRLLSLRSPVGGEVTSRLVNPGEMAVSGLVLLKVTDLDEVSLVVYATVDQLGSIHVGQAVEVQVDAYPGEVFAGTVSRIAGQAEFSPSNVQTDEDRAGMAVAVTIRLPNPEHKLKPGMPADAAFFP